MSIPTTPNYSKINFPLYSIAPLSSNHVIVSGGGGDAKTGVFNGFSVCEITYDERRGYLASEINRNESHSTIMNSAIGFYNNGKRIFLAAGIGAECVVYQVKLTSAKGGNESKKGSKEAQDPNLHQRVKGRDTNGEIKANNPPSSPPHVGNELCFDVVELMRVTTDFSPKDPYQNVVTFSCDARLLLTGGSDGILRLFNFPEMKLRSSIEVSKKEISDVDISHDKKFITAVSKDGKCRVWSTADCKLTSSFDLPPEDAGKFLYKRAKFGAMEGRRSEWRIFAILNPTNYKANKSYLQQWTGPPFALTRVASVGGALSALTVSHCGRYLAIGSMGSGDVDIYISFSLQRLKHIERAHRTFVTGLSFLPPGDEGAVLADCDAAVVSISVDNQIIVHYVERTSGISMWVAVLLVITVLLATFLICSYLDL